MDDAEAIALCKQRSPAGFDHLVRKYMREAYFHALGILGNHHDALELSQDSFVRAYTAIDRFDETRRFYPWFYRILKNACLNFLTRKRPRLNTDMGTDERPAPDIPDVRFDPAVISERNETNERLWLAIGTLSAKLREVIVLYHFRGKKYAEIGETLGIPLGTVMSRLYSARKRLKTVLETAGDYAADGPIAK